MLFDCERTSLLSFPPRSECVHAGLCVLFLIELTSCGASTTITGNLSGSQTLKVTAISPAAGNINGNFTVTLTGTLFASGMSVTLGGVGCTNVSVLSSTSLTCTAPSRSAGIVDVVVTSNSVSATLSSSFTYSTNPAPVVASISPTSSGLGVTTVVTISGSNFAATPSISIGGKPCTGPNFVNSGSLTCTTASRLIANTASVVVTNPDNQVGTLSNGFSYTGSATFTLLKSNIFSPKCYSCHTNGGSATGTFDMGNGGVYSNFIATSTEAAPTPRIAPNNVSNSFLYTKVSNGSMPPGGPALSSEEMSSIADWINTGASNN